ncbi:MAG: HAD family phosphatase, partial [Candidatus Micrarchaeia archaeon]
IMVLKSNKLKNIQEKNSGRIRAVIFDMDGTLLNSEKLWFYSARKLLRRYGSDLTLKEYIAWVGRYEGELLKKKVAEVGISKDEEELSRERRLIAVEMLKRFKLRPDPHLKKLISVLKRKKIILGIATGTNSELTTKFLKKVGLYGKFKCIITADDVKKRKPHPETYLKCAKRLGLKGSEILVFEDSETGVIAAKRAGMSCIAVPNSLSRSHNFSEADLIVRNRSKLEWKTLKAWLK